MNWPPVQAAPDPQAAALRALPRVERPAAGGGPAPRGVPEAAAAEGRTGAEVREGEEEGRRGPDQDQPVDKEEYAEGILKIIDPNNKIQQHATQLEAYI